MALYCVFDSDAFWGSHPRGDTSSCSCRDCSFGGIRVVDPVAAKEEPFPAGSLGYKLDALLASQGEGRKVSTTQVDNNSGFAWDTSSGANVAFISDGHYSIVLSGAAQGIEGDDDNDGLAPAERSAWSLLGFYFDHCEEDVPTLLSSLAGGLATLTGSWSFVLHDRRHHRVIAATDKEGTSKLLWGEAANGYIQFATTSDSAVDDTTDLFPAGCLFISSAGSKAYETFVEKGCPGTLISYVNKAPAKGGVTRVRSRGNLSSFNRSSSGVDISLIKTYAKGMVRESPSFTDLMGKVNEGN